MAVNFVCLLLDYHIFREPPTGRKEIVENQVLKSAFIFSYSVSRAVIERFWAIILYFEYFP